MAQGGTADGGTAVLWFKEASLFAVCSPTADPGGRATAFTIRAKSEERGEVLGMVVGESGSPGLSYPSIKHDQTDEQGQPRKYAGMGLGFRVLRNRNAACFMGDGLESWMEEIWNLFL